MSSGAHRGDHDIAFFEAAIEETRVLAVSAAGEELPDSDGALRPGRYLIQFLGAAAAGICWVHVGAFQKGVPLGPTVGPGLRRVPLSVSGVMAIEYNALGGSSDRIAGIMESGAGTLYVTRISSATRKG